MVQCNTCGAENTGNETECSRCGAWLGSGGTRTVSPRAAIPVEVDAEIITQRPTESMQLSVLALGKTGASAPEETSHESKLPTSPESLKVARVHTFKMPLKRIKALADERLESTAAEPSVEIEDCDSEELPLTSDYSEPILPPIESTSGSVEPSKPRDADRGHPVVTRSAVLPAAQAAEAFASGDETLAAKSPLRWVLVLLVLVALGIGIAVAVTLLGGSEPPEDASEGKKPTETPGPKGPVEPVKADTGTTFEPVEEEPRDTVDAPRAAAEDLWGVGNTWLYRVTRGDSADAQEGERQSFIVRQWVAAVEPAVDTSDVLVTFKESGGPYDKRERTSSFVIRDGCYYFGSTIPIGTPGICPSSVDAEPLELNHARYRAGAIQIGERKVWFADGIGFVKQELRTEGNPPLTRELLAYSLGSAKYGDADVQPVVCDWGQSLRVRRTAKKTAVRLAGDNGLTKAVLRKTKTSADLLLYADEEQEPTVLPLEYPPKYLKLWTNPLNGVEFLLVQTGTNTENRVRLFRLDRDSQQEVVLEPKLPGSFSTLLLANETQCFLRLRLRTDAGPQVADYSLMGDEIVPIYGSLEVSQH
ncbi:MAG: hypothetical protein AUK47_15775 [Deltaproteobacteria bacterium CG2_30_63_29]|nr:MAG: hypothetical protein AUK47_15775 [Deltaproteobacteria bacterium CG2_30_63_29]